MTPPNADAALRVFLREALGERSAKSRKTLRRCRRRLSEDSVHDLRVESRRLLATLDALDGLVPRRMVQSATRAIKKWTGGLGLLRDLQVQRGTVDELSPHLPALSELSRRLARSERRRTADTTGKLDRHAGRALGQAVSDLRGALRKPTPASAVASAVRPLVPALAAAGEAMAARFAAIDPERPATIHRARKELRRFRYLAEVFQPIVPAITQRYLDRLQRLQGDMGRIQDATVLNATVDRYLSKHAKMPRLADHTRTVLESRRAALIDAFLRHPPARSAGKKTRITGDTTSVVPPDGKRPQERDPADREN